MAARRSRSERSTHDERPGIYFTERQVFGDADIVLRSRCECTPVVCKYERATACARDRDNGYHRGNGPTTSTMEKIPTNACVLPRYQTLRVTPLIRSTGPGASIHTGMHGQ